MKPIFLYIENFTSHQKSAIDFSGFSTALIVGKSNNNDLISNGVGKTSIFRAIEWVLFNQTKDAITDKDILLEDLILEGTKKCKVIFDFAIDNEVFRVIRARTDKGVADLSFFKRSSVYDARNAHIIDTDKDLWIDISSRRAIDTEEDLIKKIKMNYKAFISTSHFLQFDFKSGLAAATPAYRKTILKEVLDLVIYSKLEKLAKTNADNLLKEIEKYRNALAIFGTPDKDIDELNNKILNIDIKINNSNNQLIASQDELYKLNTIREDLLSKYSILENQTSSSISKKDNLSIDIKNINNSIEEYNKKRKELATISKTLIIELESLKKEQDSINNINQDKIDICKMGVHDISINIATALAKKASLTENLQELNVPLPNDGACKHCRQKLTKEHLENCKKDIEQQIIICNSKINEQTNFIEDQIKQQYTQTKQLKVLENTLLRFNSIASKISIINKDLQDKKNLHAEYSEIIEKYLVELNNKNIKLEQTKLDIKQASEDELVELQNNINKNKDNIQNITSIIYNINNALNDLNMNKAVLSFSIKEKQEQLVKKCEIEKEIITLEQSFSTYPFVIQAFSSTGIPSIIINNILEDLQTETNNLLSQLRPGLQLAFEIEKINVDGTKDDTLNIIYYLNNKERKYGQLSGAQKVVVMFCLKLGLSFLLKKIMGTQLNLLMIDEIDQPMDDASVDALADIIKHFQKDFTILLITHRKRLQDKFNTAILVEQNQDMVSTAQVISW